MFEALRARRRVALAGRGFWLEQSAGPLEPVAGRWEPRRDAEAPPPRPEHPATVAVTLDNSGACFTPRVFSGPEPSREELAADRDALAEANGRLVARVRVLEAALRAAGIEPPA